MSKFEEVFNVNKESYTLVSVEQDKVVRLNEFVEELVKAKKIEAHHHMNGLSEHKRFYTGFLGELALEKFLGEEFVDWTIADSVKFHVSDLKQLGLKIGVKTVNYGMFPVIFKKSYYPEIICVKLNDTDVVICGLATIDVLGRYQSDEYIMDYHLRSRGTKTAFLGLEHLITFNSISDLKKYSR